MGITIIADVARAPEVEQAAAGESSTAALLKLLTFLSPAFPVGSFSYSHGLEWLIDQGAIRDADEVCAWAADLLLIGTGWNDAVLFAEAHRAAADADWARLSDLAELAEALTGSRERHLETTAQGDAFVQAVATAWDCEATGRLRRRTRIAYPVAVGALSAGQGIGADKALPAYLNAFAANLISVAVRLVPLGQTAGLRVLASLHPVIEEVADRALRSSLDDLGSAALLSEIAAMRHETQYSRVFRT